MHTVAGSCTVLGYNEALKKRCTRHGMNRGMHVHQPNCLGYGCRRGIGLRVKRNVWRLGAAGPEDPEPKMFNPFEKKDKNKEDAAKKALSEMFSGKKDVLAAFDGGDGGDDGGDNSDGGGGGGGGWNWSWEDWKGRLGNVGSEIMKMLGSLGKTLGAILLFAAVVLGLSLIGPASRWLVKFLRVLFRLDKASEVFVNPTEPAGTQRSVLFDEEDEEDEEDNDDE